MNPAEQLISLAFPSFQKPKKKVDWMQEPYYSSGVAEKSYPIASVVGPLKGFNVLRKWLLGQTVKPKPTTAPLALTDQSIDYPRLMAPPDRPRLEGPPDLPRLTYNPRRTDEEHQAYVNQVDDDFQRYLDHAQDEGPIENYTNAEMLRMGYTQAEIDRMEDEPGWTAQPVEGDFDDDEPDWDANAAVNFDAAGNRYPNDGSLVSDKEFYTQPKGFTSALSKILAGDSLNKAEKESALREIKYSQIAYDRKAFDRNDPEDDEYTYAKWYDFYGGDEGNILRSGVPNLTDAEAIKKFKEEKPLEFTVRQSEDYVGGEEGTKASHLYFDSNQKGAQHFFSDGRPAQAFITHNVNGGTFNIEESQDETRGKGNTYSNQVITKLAQQTVLDWADSGLSTITIPTGEAIFDKYYLSYGKGLWADEKNLLKIKDDDEFDKKAQEFYNQPIIRFEIQKNMQKHIRMAQESGDVEEWLYSDHGQNLLNEHGADYRQIVRDIALDNGLITRLEGMEIIVEGRAEKLKGLKGNYQGKVRHYNEYVKQVKKALKQHGADIEHFGKTVADDWETVIEIKNPEETIRRTKKDGFTMAMNILKGIADRQVA